MREEIETHAMQMTVFVSFIVVDRYLRQDFIEALIFYVRVAMSTVLFLVYALLNFYKKEDDSKKVATAYYSTTLIADAFIFLKTLIVLHGKTVCDTLNSFEPSIFNCLYGQSYSRRIYTSVVCFIICIFFFENLSSVINRVGVKPPNPLVATRMINVKQMDSKFLFI